MTPTDTIELASHEQLRQAQSKLDAKVRAWVEARQNVPVGLWPTDPWTEAEYVPTRIRRRDDLQPAGIAWTYDAATGLIAWIPESALGVPTGPRHVTDASRFLRGVLFDLGMESRIVRSFCDQAAKIEAKAPKPVRTETRTCPMCGTEFVTPVGTGHDRKYCSRECTDATKHGKVRPKVETDCPVKYCACGCAEPLPPRVSGAGRPARYASPVCAKRDWYRQHPENRTAIQRRRLDKRKTERAARKTNHGG